jgi:hypothetical protein
MLGSLSTNMLVRQMGSRDQNTNSCCIQGKWKGQSNFTSRFIAQHRNYVSIQQLPNTCHISATKTSIAGVRYLLTQPCNDAGLQAAMASIKTDQAINGM